MSRRRFAYVRVEVYPHGLIWGWRVRPSNRPDQFGEAETLVEARRAARAVAASLRREIKATHARFSDTLVLEPEEPKP